MLDFTSMSRQMQWGFEMQYHMSRMFAGVQVPNPLIQPTSGEAEKMKLEVDTAAISSWLCGVFYRNPKLCCPGCCISWTLGCAPCAMVMAMQNVEPAAAAHKLTLRETTLHYKVEKYNAVGTIPTNFDTTAELLLCCALNHQTGKVGKTEIEEVFPLEMVTEVSVQPNFGQTCCGLPRDGTPSSMMSWTTRSRTLPSPKAMFSAADPCHSP